MFILRNHYFWGMIMKKSIQKLLLVALLGLSSIAPVATLATQYISTQVEINTNYENRILQSINTDSMYNHITHLSKTPRVAGSPEEDTAVTFIKKELDSYGYKTEVQSFPFKQYISPHTLEVSVENFTKDLQPLSMEYSIDGHVSGEVISAGKGKVEELQNLDLTGKIALLERGDISFVEKVIESIFKNSYVTSFFESFPSGKENWRKNLKNLEFDSILGILNILGIDNHGQLFNVLIDNRFV